ncbi:conserved hypothetical protein [Ricinus communis]|uniref:Uncharacterized protein n=1 Tax=Ricinus communis TaxID=3988 RepID=B9TQP4_RICCO|nr:conserved hypothetical protein [Ricinus communis]
MSGSMPSWPSRTALVTIHSPPIRTTKAVTDATPASVVTRIVSRTPVPTMRCTTVSGIAAATPSATSVATSGAAPRTTTSASAPIAAASTKAMRVPASTSVAMYLPFDRHARMASVSKSCRNCSATIAFDGTSHIMNVPPSTFRRAANGATPSTVAG